MPYLSLGLCCICFGRKSSRTNSAGPFTVTSNALNRLCQEAGSAVNVTAEITFFNRPISESDCHIMPKNIWEDLSQRGESPTLESGSCSAISIQAENGSLSRQSLESIDSAPIESTSDELQEMMLEKDQALKLTTHILDLLTKSESTYSDDPQSIREQMASNPLLKAHRLVDILLKNPNAHTKPVKQELIRCLTDFNQYLTASKLDLFNIDNYSLSKLRIKVPSDLKDAIDLLDKRHITPFDQELLIKKMNGLKGISLDAIRNKLSNLETQQKYRQILRNFLITTNMLGEARALEMHKEYLLEFNL